MEMIQIGRGRLKVMMSKPDMCEYELDCDKMDSSDFHTRYALKRILKKAKEQCGFVAQSERMLVQIFPSKNGGCEIFVTVLGIDSPKEKHKEETVMVFESFDLLLLVCDKLSSLGFGGESRAYYGESGETYLKLTGEISFSALCEYAGTVPAKKFALSEWEHMHIISEPDAVHTLAGFYV